MGVPPMAPLAPPGATSLYQDSHKNFATYIVLLHTYILFSNNCINNHMSHLNAQMGNQFLMLAHLPFGFDHLGRLCGPIKQCYGTYNPI